MKILVFGAGGVGSLVGGFLARGGNDVSLVGRSWHIDAIRKQGLKITGIFGQYFIKALELYTDVSQIYNKNFDLIFITVKSYDTKSAVEILKPLISPKTTVVSLQNGLDSVDQILTSIPKEQYLPGRIITGIEIEPAHVNVTVSADAIQIGALPGVKPIMNALQITRMMSDAKLPAAATEEILTVLWAKAIYNCALNPICAIHEIPYGKILENPDTRKWMGEIVEECYAVGLKKGVVLKPNSAALYRDLLEGQLIPKTAAHFPSMLQDLRKKKRTEIESLNGAISRMGQTFQIPTPANDKAIQELLKKTAK